MRGRQGEKCEHVNAREGGRCACRGWSLASGSSLCLPFSPALSLLAVSPHPFATVGKVHPQSFHHFFFQFSLQLIAWTASLVLLSVWTIPPSVNSATGAIFRRRRAHSGSGGWGWGGWGESRDRPVV